jgi:hypothetical protein
MYRPRPLARRARRSSYSPSSSWTRTSCAALILSTTAAPALAAQVPTDPDLELGPHAVGFSVIAALDSTRAFRPARAADGTYAAETARPVQISVWYPAAAPQPGAPRVSAGEFRLLAESEVDFDAVPTDAEAASLRSEFIAVAVDRGRSPAGAERLWDAPTAAIRDAPALPGAHPTVLYFTSAGVNNPGLPAYLASHGFVVASFPSNGRMTAVSLQFSPNPLTLDTDIDDAGFVHAVLRRMPYADARRLAVASFSSGSLAALLWTMRDMQPSAIVAFEGWERYLRGAEIVSASPLYDPLRVRVPFLMLERAADEASPAYAKVGAVVDSLPYADITRVSFRDAAHGDFLSHAPFGHTPDQPRIFATAARTTRLFLDATLRGDAAAAAELAALEPPPGDPFFSVARRDAIGPVPSEEELFRLAETDPTALDAAYRAAAAIVEGRRLFREDVLTRAAQFADAPADRAAIMAVVASAYPESVAVAFGLGQALAAAGRDDDASAAYRRALEAVASDPGLADGDREGWRERIQAALVELSG